MKADCNLNYVKLAPLYDAFMEGIDYEGWVSYVEKIIDKFGGNVHKVADLACGTGNSTFPWAMRGYRTWGIDLSPEMLKFARMKAEEKQLNIEFLCQDLRRMHLEEPVNLAVCFQDGFNYLLNPVDLEKAFKAVYRNLTEEGFFVFDLNYLPRIIPQDGEISFIENDRCSMAWRSRFLEEGKVWEIEVKGEIKKLPTGENSFYERHKERIYESGEVCSLLTAQNFTILGTYQAFTFDPPHLQTPKIVFVAQKV